MEYKMYTVARKLLKEVGLDCGLVQTIFRPCAEQLVSFLNENLEEGTKITRVLDVGCGSGIVSRVIADYNSKLKFKPTIKFIHGLDCKEAAIEVANIKTIHDERFKFWQDNATNFKTGEDKYDVIIVQHLIQHLKENDQMSSLNCMRNALKTGGYLVLGVWPKLTSDCEAYNFLYKAADQKIDCIGMEVDDLVMVVKKAGFDIVREFSGIRFRTKPIESRLEFLRQYFEGSLRWLGKDEKDWKCKFKRLVSNSGLNRPAGGLLVIDVFEGVSVAPRTPK
jgi:ubiquinone/menaquinone biosynthesis C-methylase UbiE